MKLRWPWKKRRMPETLPPVVREMIQAIRYVEQGDAIRRLAEKRMDEGMVAFWEASCIPIPPIGDVTTEPEPR